MAGDKMTIIEVLAAALFAGIGGSLAYMYRMTGLDKKPRLTHALVEGLSSSFVGVIAMLLCKAAEMDWYWAGAIIGVLGWLGPKFSIALLKDRILSNIGFRNDR